MTISRILLLLASSISVDAFVTSPHVPLQLSSQYAASMPALSSKTISTVALKMSDFDFPSAMPEKPKQTMEEQLRDSATSFIADITARLGKEVAPPELEALRKVRDDEGSDVQTLSLRIYELMIGECIL